MASTSADARAAVTTPRAMCRMALSVALGLAAGGLSVIAQAPATRPPQAQPQAQQLHANMNQLMRGALYPAANVVFFVQAEDPAGVKPIPGDDPSMATDPLRSTFGGWQAVENAALALAETANLMSLPGRACANGVTAPVKDPVWAAFVQAVRDDSMKAFSAAQAKDQETMTAVAETLSEACAGCHRKWRDRRPAADRCK